MAKLDYQKSFELMKDLFEEYSITFIDGVLPEEVGFYTIVDGVEKRLPDNFLKDFNKEI